jgi:limonene-1,2-epoxide hydrolase
MTTSLETVRKFCEAFSRKDPDELLEFLDDDAVYHNMPMAPVRGKAAIRMVLDMFLKPAQSVEFVMLNLAASGNTVLTERLDKFRIGDRAVDLPVAGVFEVEGGKITSWRDYFDMATWTKQTSGT